MQNALLRNRVFAVVTAIAMVFGSLSMVLAPSTVSAATGGDLIKGTSLSTVYYYGYDGYRYTFPNEKTYMTWFSDFSNVETISDSALADISLAGNVVYRAGSRWIKITSADDVYAVSTDGTIRWIESEDVAVDYAGSDWASYVEDVPDVFFTNYTSGASLSSATAYDGMMYMDGSDHYLAWDGEARMVSSAGMSANDMQSRFFLDGSGIDSSSLSSGSDITSEVSAVTDVAQQGGTTTTTTDGDVTVSLSSSNPTGVSVPTNANMVDVLSIDLTAGSEATTVNQIAVSMIGLSAASDVSSIYLYEGDTRLTEARSVNTSTRQATFGTLNIDLDAYETRTITARVTISATAGDQIQFGISEADDIDADGDISGSFPLEGNTFEVSGTSVGEVTIVDSGTISNPSLGEQDAKIGAFKATTATEAGYVESLTLKVDNGADHSDYKLWADGSVVATGEYIGDKLVVFDLDSYYIAKGQSEIFSLTADIGGDAADTIYVYMSKAVDVDVTGADYGFAMAATIIGYDNTDSTERNSSTIQGGDVTMASSGPTAGDIKTNSTDVTLLNFTLTSAQAITVQDLDVIVYVDDDGDNDPFDAADDGTDTDDDGLINSDDEGNITNIRIVNTDTGETLMGPLELDDVTGSTGDDADQTIDFTSDFDMTAGETLNLAVMVDVDDNLTSGTELGASIAISGFAAEDVNGDTLTNSTDVVPTSDIQGYAQQALSASLTISLASTPGDTSTVRGVSDLLMNSFNFVAGSGGDVIVTDIVLDIEADDDGSGTFTNGDVTNVDVNDFISSCSIYDNDGDLISGPESPASDGTTVTFSNVSWTIDASESERLDVKCNLAKPSSGSDDDYFAIDINDADVDVLAVDTDNNTVDADGDAVNGGTSPTNVVTVSQSGSLASTVDSSTPEADFLLTGTTDNHVATFRMTATTEDFTVDTLSITEEAAEDMNGTSDSSAYVNNISLVTLEYPNEAGDTVTTTGTMVGNEATFTGLDMYVTYGDPSLVKVYVDVPATDRVSGNATSNEKVEIGISAGSGDFKAYGVSSGVQKIESDITALETDKAFVVRETKPTISISSASPLSGTASPGDIEVFRFNVAASSNQDVVMNELVFELSTTDIGTSDWNTCSAAAANEFTASSFDLYDTDDLATALTGTFVMLASTGAQCNTASSDNAVKYIQLTLSSAEVVPAGTTKTYTLYIDTTYASAANDDVISVKLASDPITTTFVDSGLLINDGSGVAVIDTTVTYDGTPTALTSVTAGTIIQIGSEDMLVTAIASPTITVIRGYLNTTVATHADNATISELPSAFVWEDDGDTSSSATGEDWGAYLVDSLPVSGHTLQF